MRPLPRWECGATCAVRGWERWRGWNGAQVVISMLRAWGHCHNSPATTTATAAGRVSARSWNSTPQPQPLPMPPPQPCHSHSLAQTATEVSGTSSWLCSSRLEHTQVAVPGLQP